MQHRWGLPPHGSSSVAAAKVAVAAAAALQARARRHALGRRQIHMLITAAMAVAGEDLGLFGRGTPEGHTPFSHTSGTPAMQRRQATAPGIQE